MNPSDQTPLPVSPGGGARALGLQGHLQKCRDVFRDLLTGWLLGAVPAPRVEALQPRSSKAVLQKLKAAFAQKAFTSSAPHPPPHQPHPHQPTNQTPVPPFFPGPDLKGLSFLFLPVESIHQSGGEGGHSRRVQRVHV